MNTDHGYFYDEHGQLVSWSRVILWSWESPDPCPFPRLRVFRWWPRRARGGHSA